MNTIDVEYEVPIYAETFDEEMVVNWVNRVLKRMDKDEVELSISFVSDKEIQELNKEYRKLDMPTDILSFVQSDCQMDDDFWPSEMVEDFTILGDMIISPDALKRNCENFGATEDDELKRLLIHGTLHLLGMDHKTNDFKSEEMLILQEDILKELKENSNELL
jgi:probable rRNA maturation factor